VHKYMKTYKQTEKRTKRQTKIRERTHTYVCAVYTHLHTYTHACTLSLVHCESYQSLNVDLWDRTSTDDARRNFELYFVQREKIYSLAATFYCLQFVVCICMCLPACVHHGVSVSMFMCMCVHVREPLLMDTMYRDHSRIQVLTLVTSDGASDDSWNSSAETSLLSPFMARVSNNVTLR